MKVAKIIITFLIAVLLLFGLSFLLDLEFVKQNWLRYGLVVLLCLAVLVVSVGVIKDQLLRLRDHVFKNRST